MTSDQRKTLEAMADYEDGAAEEAEDFQGAIPLAEEYRRGAAAIRAALAEVDALTQQVADLTTERDEARESCEREALQHAETRISLEEAVAMTAPGTGTDLTTQADRALAHRYHFKATDGAAEDWIEGRSPFDTDEIVDDVRDLAVMFAKVRGESARVALSAAKEAL